MTTSTTMLLYIASDAAVPVTPLARIAGLPIAERVLRCAFRAGCAGAIVFDPERTLEGIAARIDERITLVFSPDEWRAALEKIPDSTPATIIGPGTVVSPQFLRNAATVSTLTDKVADVPAGPAWPVSGVIRMRVKSARDLSVVLGSLRDRLSHVKALPSGEEISKGRGQFVIRLRGMDDLPSAEVTLRRAVFKPTDATLARFNRRISLPISIALVPTPLTANQMSAFIVLLGFWAAWLFSGGDYLSGVAAAFLSLAASVLDGCDGEIARLKYQESALGCWIETFGDYSYYLAIFGGLTIGAVARTGSAAYFWFGGIGIAGTILTFALLIFLRSRITAGQPETLHAIARERFKADPVGWSRVVWRISFVATRSAMPYGIMALALVYALPMVVVLFAIGANIYWVSLVLKLRHLLGTESGEAVAA